MGRAQWVSGGRKGASGVEGGWGRGKRQVERGKVGDRRKGEGSLGWERRGGNGDTALGGGGQQQRWERRAHLMQQEWDSAGWSPWK